MAFAALDCSSASTAGSTWTPPDSYPQASTQPQFPQQSSPIRAQLSSRVSRSAAATTLANHIVRVLKVPRRCHTALVIAHHGHHRRRRDSIGAKCRDPTPGYHEVLIDGGGLRDSTWRAVAGLGGARRLDAGGPGSARAIARQAEADGKGTSGGLRGWWGWGRRRGGGTDGSSSRSCLATAWPQRR